MSYNMLMRRMQIPLIVLGVAVPIAVGQDLVTLKKQAEQGDVAAQEKLGNAYFSGNYLDGIKTEYVKQNEAEGIKWLSKAAESKEVKGTVAASELVEIYRSRSDYSSEAIYLRKLAELGFAAEQAQLGFFYMKGRGVQQDYTLAAIWLRKSADQGEEVAQLFLGDLYSDGNGVPKDYSQSITWYRKAAEQGNASAQLKLGHIYLFGLGVPEDDVEAYCWFDIVLAAGKLEDWDRQVATKNRTELESKLSHTDLLMAQERASKWFEGHASKNTAK